MTAIVGMPPGPTLLEFLADVTNTSVVAGAVAVHDGSTFVVHTTNSAKFGQVDVDNVRVNGNAIDVTDTNGALTVDANGSGTITIGGTSTGDIILGTGGGDVSIGAATPTATLNLERASADVGIRIDRTGSGAATFLQQVDANGDFRFNLETSANLRFYTNSLERFTITSAGDHGFGTPTPDGTVHVHTASAGTVTANANADDLVVENTDKVGISLLCNNTGTGAIFFGDADDNNIGFLEYKHDGDFFRIGTTNAERVRVDSSGNLGVGTTTPGAKVHSEITAVGTIGLLVKGIASQTADYVNIDNSTGSNGNVFTITEAGHVGISYPNAPRLLSVQGTSDAVQDPISLIRDNRTTTGDNFNMVMSIARQNSATAAYHFGNDANNNAILATNAAALRFGKLVSTTFTEFARWDTSGNLLINGTSTPTSSVGNLVMFNGTIPSASVTDGIVLYPEDVTGSSELKVRDEGGTVTQLSPHDDDGYWIMNHQIPKRRLKSRIHLERLLRRLAEIHPELLEYFEDEELLTA